MPPARILIVENDQQVTAELKSRLTGLGYDVAGTATSTEQALQKSSKLKPDLILINTRLASSEDGIKTGQLIRSQNAAPIVYITTQASQTMVRRANSTEPFGYIIKPFDDAQLFATVEIALTRHRLEKQLTESRQWLNGVLMSVGEGVIAIDNRGLIRFVNPYAEHITGWQNYQAIDKEIYKIFDIRDEQSGEILDLSISQMNSREAGGDNRIIEAVLITKDKNKLPVEVQLNPIFNQDDAFHGLVISFRDMTQKRRTLEQIKQQASRAEALVQIAKLLNSRFDLKDVLGSVCSATNNILRTSASMVFLLDIKSGRYNDIARKFEDDIPVARSNPVKISFSRTELEKYISEDVSAFALSDVNHQKELPLRATLRLLGITHLAVAPITRSNEAVGALICGSVGGQEFLSADLDFLTGLAEHIMIAIENTRLFEHVRLGRERQQLLSRSIVNIQESERRRIAQELHDHLGQELTGIQFMLESMKNQLEGSQREDVMEMQESVTNIISQVREMSLNLRPSMLDDLGLLPTLNWLLDRYSRQTGIQVNFNRGNISGRFPEEVETTAYRIVQEALTNVARHSQVNEAFIGLAVDDRALWIEILDKGRGFDTSAVLGNPTSGLSGMSERATLAGGYLSINSYINQGTQIVAALPISDKPLERRKYDRNGLPG